jgi:competence CoiA-like predicted nuclease
MTNIPEELIGKNFDYPCPSCGEPVAIRDGIQITHYCAAWDLEEE